MGWRRLLIVLHRDMGFACLGLTLVYGVSGLAVNHREHWDYNYALERTVHTVGTPRSLLGPTDSTQFDASIRAPRMRAREEQTRLVQRLLDVLQRDEQPTKVFWRGSERLSLFFGTGDTDVIDYLPSTGVVEMNRRRERFLLRQLNILHLNERRGIWTYVADVYAVLLLFLAISGVIVVKGRSGLWGRGGALVAIGVLIPIIALLL